MGVFDALNETSNKAQDSGESYLKASQEYYKLKVFQQLTKALSFFSKLAIIGGLLFMSAVFLTVSGTIWLGKLIGNTSLACLLMAGILLLFTGLAYGFRKQIDRKIIKKMSKDFFN
ncbi:hypothetical protein [Aquimarina rubra]|uniref:Phage holin family protein n=1 Tax=Aquimarina rubra TaxID=1920033 RepID=A0ABW5LJV4_9FLAO